MDTPVFSPNYLTDSDGKRISVVLTLTDFEKIMELLEELEDVRLYDSVKSRNESRVPLNDYLETRKLRANA